MADNTPNSQSNKLYLKIWFTIVVNLSLIGLWHTIKEVHTFIVLNRASNFSEFNFEDLDRQQLEAIETQTLTLLDNMKSKKK